MSPCHSTRRFPAPQPCSPPRPNDNFPSDLTFPSESCLFLYVLSTIIYRSVFFLDTVVLLFKVVLQLLQPSARKSSQYPQESWLPPPCCRELSYLLSWKPPVPCHYDLPWVWHYLPTKDQHAGLPVQTFHSPNVVATTPYCRLLGLC